MRFPGEAAGDSAKILTNNALGFDCVGRYAACPDNYGPSVCGEPVGGCVGSQVWNRDACRCECAGNVLGVCPGSHVWDVERCECVVSAVVQRQREEVGYCCLTDFRIFAGECWGKRSERACGEMGSHLGCYWDVRNCLPDPPVNDVNVDRACRFAGEECRRDGDCCSEHCRVNGMCW